MGDVVDARSHHQPQRRVPGLYQLPEILAGKVRCERLAGRRLIAARLSLHGRPDGDELGQRRAPLVLLESHAHAHDPIGAERVGLGLHA